MPPTLPTDHDDDVRGLVRLVADRLRSGRRLRITATARRRDRRRAPRLAMADALHDPGHLPLPRSPEPPARRFAPPVAPRRGADRLAEIGRQCPWRRRM